MPNIRMIMLQESNEKKFSRKLIDGYIKDEIASNADTQARITYGVELVQDYMGKSYYASKNARVAQLANLDLVALVTSIFIGIAYCRKEVLFTSITAQLAGRLNFSDKTAAITTVAELLAVLCMTDAFDINKATRGASLMVQSCIQLSDELLEAIDNSEYLPPMVCIPKELDNNRSSGYLYHNDSLILGGAANHHDGDLCLDVLNKMNAIPLKLSGEYISAVNELPTFDLEESWEKMKPEVKAKLVKHQWIQAQKDNWEIYKAQGYIFYSLMVNQGNRFYITNKVDKRGRIYCSGFHISSQGSSHKKSMVELANEELVEGVPHG